MKRFTTRMAAGLALTALAASAGAVSLSATGPAQPLPDDDSELSATASTAPRAGMLLTARSAALVPLMAADSAPADVSTVEPTAPTGGNVSGKPVDDISFVSRATVNNRMDMNAAREA